MSSVYDCIVLGVGGFGSGALYHLARRGLKVLGLEQFSPVHDRGSSHGETRIIRQAYYEHPDYVPLLLRGYELWNDLESETGKQVLFPVGLFLAGYPGGEVVPGTEHAAALHGLPLDCFTPEEARRRFPGYDFPDDFRIIFERQAGYLAVEECVRTHISAALQLGAELRSGETVLGWEVRRGTVHVRTDQGEYQAARLVITAGAWASQLLAGLNVQLRVLRKFLGWFPTQSDVYNASEGNSTFVYELPGGKFFYGFPSIDGQAIKVAEHSGGDEVADPRQVDRSAHPVDVQNLAGFVRDYLPQVGTALDRHAVCLYTMSPDSHFVVDRHPQHPQVVFGAGFSGHGFKFTSVIGEALADLAADGKTALPIDFLSLARFAPKQKT
jgi:sarcosine oxidase